jgi:hypothetical protein
VTSIYTGEKRHHMNDIMAMTTTGTVIVTIRVARAKNLAMLTRQDELSTPQ